MNVHNSFATLIEEEGVVNEVRKTGNETESTRTTKVVSGVCSTSVGETSNKDTAKELEGQVDEIDVNSQGVISLYQNG